MKIDDKENINEILLKHTGRNIDFKCYIEPYFGKDLDLIEKKTVVIAFDDLTEVQALIDILKKFKEETQTYIGIWEEV